MARKKKYSPQEKAEILEGLKKLWENSEDITYRQMEEVQKEKWGQVVYKMGTLRNKASKEGWNRDKGKSVEEQRKEKREELIEAALPEALERIGSKKEHHLLMKSLDNKYRPVFEAATEKLMEAIQKEDLKGIKFSEATFRALKMARKMDLELLGVLDAQEYKKIELEALKLQLLTVAKTDRIYYR